MDSSLKVAVSMNKNNMQKRFKKPSDYIVLKKLERENGKYDLYGFCSSYTLSLFLIIVFLKKRDINVESNMKEVTVEIVKMSKPSYNSSYFQNQISYKKKRI